MKQKHHWLLVAGIVIGVLGVAVVGATIDTVAGTDTTQSDGTFDHDVDHHAAHQDDHTVHHDHAHADGEFTDRNDTRHPDAVHGEYPHDSTDEYHPRDSTDEYHPRDSTDHRRGGPCH